MSNTFEAIVLETIRYFSFFKFAPDFGEIYTFLKKKSSKSGLASILENMAKKKVIKRSQNGDLYTLPQYANRLKIYDLRFKNSKEKIDKIKPYIKLLSFFPQIKLVGLSGTVAMMNAYENDDIDLFTITARNRLFTGRIIALVLSQILGLRRTRTANYFKNKVCLNLFFDESDLRIPKYKQTEYVSHEVLQMKPLINKNNTYERFLDKNKWVYNFFPNAKKLKTQKIDENNSNFLENLVENLLKKLQLISIKQHQTSEIVTDTQLWFFPEDFEKKMPLTEQKKLF